MTDPEPVREPLDYGQMLGALQDRLHQEVAVEIHLRFHSRERPLVAFWGVLRKAEAFEFPEGEKHDLGTLGGEWVMFAIDQGLFALRRDDFKRGRRIGDSLLWETGRFQISVSRPLSDEEVERIRQEFSRG